MAEAETDVAASDGLSPGVGDAPATTTLGDLTGLAGFGGRTSPFLGLPRPYLIGAAGCSGAFAASVQASSPCSEPDCNVSGASSVLSLLAGGKVAAGRGASAACLGRLAAGLTAGELFEVGACAEGWLSAFAAAAEVAGGGGGKGTDVASSGALRAFRLLGVLQHALSSR